MSLPVPSDDDDGLGEISIDAEGGESHVIDDAQYSHQRRLRAIHNSHDRVIEVRNVVEDRLISREMDEYHARRYYRGAVESFLMEIMPVLRSGDIQLEKPYRDGVDLGEVTISPPKDLVDFARSNIQRLAPGATVPTSKSTHVQGLQSVLTLPSPMTHQFRVAVQEGRGVQTATRTVREELPRDILDKAVQLCMEALEDAQMGLNVGEGRPHNNAGAGDGKWPWETDSVLPHEVHDAIENGEISRDELEAIIDEE